MMLANNVGDKLWLLMAENRIRSVTELQNRSGVSRVTISKILNKKVDSVSMRTLVNLCKVLNCEISYLIQIKNVS